MATANKWTGIGRVTAEPESRAAGQFQIMQVRFCVNERSKKDAAGNWINDPNPLWIDLEVWKRDKKGLYEVIEEYVKKGDELYVEGKLKMESWEDKNGGGKRSKVKLELQEMQMLGGKKDFGGGDSAPAPRSAPRPAPVVEPVEEGDIPF